MTQFHPNRARTWLLATLVLAVAGCQNGDNAKADEESEEEVLPTPVEVAVVSSGNISAVYTGTATLEADGEALVMAKVGGLIEKLLVNEGDVVKVNQPIARIEDDRLKLEVKRARANLERTAQEYRRNVELHEKG